MRKLLVAVVVLMAALVGYWTVFGGASADGDAATVAVRRGTIRRDAVAVGRIEAEREFAVKSLSSGVVARVLVKLGQRVKAGSPLAEVRPVLSTADHIRAERAVMAARRGEETAAEFERGAHLAAWLLRFAQGKKSVERMAEGARKAREQAEENLTLLREGRVKVGEREVDRIVRAPADGHVVAVEVREGAPVVAASSFGSGTVLVVLADLDAPVFRGTVDEIDVGRLALGMPARVTIGALPDVELTGSVAEVGLRARQRNNGVVFDVRLALDTSGLRGVTLRSGYSAVAEVTVAERTDALVVPERLVEFRGDRAFVLLQDGGAPREVAVRTGLSNGLDIEIVEGVPEGGLVCERTR